MWMELEWFGSTQLRIGIYQTKVLLAEKFHFSHSPSCDFHRNFFIGPSTATRNEKRENISLFDSVFFLSSMDTMRCKGKPRIRISSSYTVEIPHDKHLLYSFQSFSWAISRAAQSCASEKPIVI